jgi:hypothetical protein
MSMRAAWTGAFLAIGSALPAVIQAQEVDGALYAVAMSNSEVSSVQQARGFGAGAAAGLERGRVRIEVQGLTASLRGDFSTQPDYAVNELSVLGTYRWREAVALQLGASRRFTSPDFVAQEVGAIRVGLLTETPLASLARVYARAAYLPLTRFTGGGSSHLAVEFGLGISLGPRDGRYTGRIAFDYQRLDRRVGEVKVPIRWSAIRVGVVRRW